MGASIDVVAMAVIGGMSMLAGPLLGAFYIIGIPAFLPLDSAGLAATQLGWLILILYLPGGIAQGLEPVRNAVVRWLARRSGVDVGRRRRCPTMSRRPRTAIELAPALPDGRRPSMAAGTVLLGCDRPPQAVWRRHRSRRRVAHCSCQARSSVSSDRTAQGRRRLSSCSAGSRGPTRDGCRFAGQDVSELGPEQRGRLGLIRSFQDAALFPTMTVLDCVRLALERVAPTSFLASIAGLRGRERAKEQMAREIVSAMGLDVYRHRRVQELSTGTRRITEIACLIALSPTMLLLDEPSSGIAQRETEALGELLRNMRDTLDLTLLVIEHDIPLIMGVSDRIVAMDAGRVIAEGSPDDVRADQRVVEAYLGGSITAIDRSNGSQTAKRTGRRRKKVAGP